MNDAVEMTTNQFQQNISIKLADDYLNTIVTENVMTFPVDLTKIFNSVQCIVDINILPSLECTACSLLCSTQYLLSQGYASHTTVPPLT